MYNSKHTTWLKKQIMYSCKIFVFVAILFAVVDRSSGCAWCVTLNEPDFDKVSKRYAEVFVKFDVAFTYGRKYGYFATLAHNYSRVDDVLFVEVFVQKYKGSRNQALADRFQVGHNDYPAFRFLRPGRKYYGNYLTSTELTQESLRTFLFEQTAFNLNRTGCLIRFDGLAKQFIANQEERINILKKAENMSKKLKNEKLNYSKNYVTIMEKILEIGDIYLNEETQRLHKLLEDTNDPKVQKQLQDNLNVLKSFRTEPEPETGTETKKETEEENVTEESTKKDEL